VRIPKKLLVIGELQELLLEGGGQWKPRGAVLGMTLARNALWIVLRRKGTRTKIETTRVSTRPLVKRCKVLGLIYTSSAWGDGMKKYIHTFRKPPTLWSDTRKSPTILRIFGSKLSVKTDGIHG
jgi:hypothetical protein